MPRPLCFVLMPFGKKKDPQGGPDIDFDRIYEEAIRPGIEAADLDPLRADEERTGGIIHRAMFERLLLCDFAVADLTTANPNVFYELGVRHAARPATTVSLFAHAPPFDINYLRALPYELGPGNSFPPDAATRLRTRLTARLQDLRAANHQGPLTDSPLFQLLTDYKAPDIARLKTDTFRDQVAYAAGLKQKLAEARDRRDDTALAAIEAALGPLDTVEAGVLVDLFLSYRALEQWPRMIALYARLPAVLQSTVLVREQYALALNRNRQRQEALRVLESVERDQGPSSETCGLMGRVYKDLWVEAEQRGERALAAGYLDHAIGAYVRGFEADVRDAYPGINAVTLLDIQGDREALAHRDELLPVVRFAVRQRLRASRPDFWDHATLLELAVIAGEPETARQMLGKVLTSVRERWEPATTANNLKLLRTARQRRGVHEPWLDEIIAALEARAAA
jgi:tetratricopeptide (TPR) repeat protein